MLKSNTEEQLSSVVLLYLEHFLNGIGNQPHLELCYHLQQLALHVLNIHYLLQFQRFLLSDSIDLQWFPEAMQVIAGIIDTDTLDPRH